MILRWVKPPALQNWIAVNAAGSLKSTAGDSWRAYLVSQAATGNSLMDLENSFLSATVGGNHADKWRTWLAANGGGTSYSVVEQARTKFK